MKKMILIITGSVAANKGIELYLHLQKNYMINLFLTKNAQKFIKNLPMIKNEAHQNVDLIVVYPASHNFIAKIANGFCDEICSITFNSFNAPKIIFPSMNTKMYKNNANLRNLVLLKNNNIEVFEPKIGLLACKSIGLGRAWEWKEVAVTINNFFNNQKLVINN